jgi:cytochrome P450
MQLPYTKALVEETLRMYPPAYYIQRQLVKDMDMQGYRLQKGCVILTSVFALHKNPDYWDQPEHFDPDRFSSQNSDKVRKGAYMPFGMGQRICIGNQFALLEMAAVLAVMGRQFHLHPAKGYTPEMIPSITTNISEGMPMYIERAGVYS